MSVSMDKLVKNEIALLKAETSNFEMLSPSQAVRCDWNDELQQISAELLWEIL